MSAGMLVACGGGVVTSVVAALTLALILQDMMSDLEQSARRSASGCGSGDATDSLVSQLFMRWMQARPQVVSSSRASGSDRS